MMLGVWDLVVYAASFNFGSLTWKSHANRRRNR
jgi:hypothetical protein